jgi:hypothetical protein
MEKKKSHNSGKFIPFEMQAASQWLDWFILNY